MTPARMSSVMSQTSKREVLLKMRERYQRRGREGRGKLIDEVCEMCGYERKHAIRSRRVTIRSRRVKKQKGRSRRVRSDNF